MMEKKIFVNNISFKKLNIQKKLEESNYNDLYLFPPENELGNIEYKLKLINPKPEKLEHLATQMKWRLKEGEGEAIYYLGVSDKGKIIGLTSEQSKSSLKTLEKMANKLNVSLEISDELIIKTNNLEKPRKAFEIVVKKIKKEILPELRVAVLGNTSCGKSTLIGVLTQGVLDKDGNARVSLFRHRHELLCGHTSSVSREILGFSKNKVINYTGEVNFKQKFKDEFFEANTHEDILLNSKRIVSFLDLAGHKKHISTTIFGLIGNTAHLGFVVINAKKGLEGTTEEHINILIALNLPFLLIINKIDLVDKETINEEVENLCFIMKQKKRNIIEIEDENTMVDFFEKKKNLLPLIKISCFTGHNLSLLYIFLNQYSLYQKNQLKILNMISNIHPFEFLIEEVFYQDSESCVVGGSLLNGQINKNDNVLILPTLNGQSIKSKVISIQKYKVEVNSLNSTETGSLKLISQNFKIRKGMIIVSQTTNIQKLNVCSIFKVNLLIISCLKQIKPGFLAKIYVKNVKQTVCFKTIENNTQRLSCNDNCVVVLQFIKTPEIVRLGSKFLLYEDNFRAIGTVIQLSPM